MTPPPSLKRTRDDGSVMPDYREIIDGDTGERIKVQIDTTRSAKKRFKKSTGAQWQPTAGQIKAAEIWQQQEEKIRKDKERGEKRKKAANRQVTKDARIKEQQEEFLRKGRISIEDTWGKVSASQNRLNKFFTTPQRPAAHLLHPENIAESEITGRVREDQQEADAEAHDDGVTDAPDSPLSDTPRLEHHEMHSIAENPEILLCKPAPSLMLPPPVPVKNSTSVERIRHPPEEATERRDSSVPYHTPVLLSTQDVSQLFADIGSQDFDDELMDEDNDLPMADASHVSPMEKTEQPEQTADQTLVNQTHENSKKEQQELEDDDFDDSDIDDQTLMYFAATQRVTKRAKTPTSSEPTSPSSATTTMLSPKSPERAVVSPALSAKSLKQSYGPAAESFAFTDIDDSDLVQCIENFEKTDEPAETCAHDDGNSAKKDIPSSSSDSYFQDDSIDLSDEDLLKAFEYVEKQAAATETPCPVRKRRVLPWAKSPELYALAGQEEQESRASAPLTQA